MESAPLCWVIESAPLCGVMESAPLYGVMEIAPWLMGRFCCGSGAISGRRPFITPTLTLCNLNPRPTARQSCVLTIKPQPLLS